MKVRCFYLYGDLKRREKSEKIIRCFIKERNILELHTETTEGYLPYCRIRCNKKQWKELKEMLDLCKIWA